MACYLVAAKGNALSLGSSSLSPPILLKEQQLEVQSQELSAKEARPQIRPSQDPKLSPISSKRLEFKRCSFKSQAERLWLSASRAVKRHVLA